MSFPVNVAKKVTVFSVIFIIWHFFIRDIQFLVFIAYFWTVPGKRPKKLLPVINMVNVP